MPIVQDGVISEMAAAIKQAKRPVVYAGGGIISAEASSELNQFLAKTGIPVTTTVMGIGAVPPSTSIHWIGWGCMAQPALIMLSEIAIF